MNFIKRIEEVDNLEIGNKALNLKRLTKQNINVPKSWVISSEVFMNILKEKGFNIENKGIYIDGDLRLEEFKTSIAWILSIITIAIEVILKEYLDNYILQKEFDTILIYFEKNFKDLLNK